MHFHAKEVILYQFDKTKLQNITATLLICKDAEIEPTPQRLTAEKFYKRTANKSEEF